MDDAVEAAIKLTETYARPELVRVNQASPPNSVPWFQFQCKHVRLRLFL